MERPFAVGLDPHARIGVRVALEKRHLGLSAVDSGRQEGRQGAERVDGAERGVMIDVLEGHLVGLLRIGRGRQPGALRSAEVVVGGLIADDGLARARSIEAVGHSLVGRHDAQSEACGCVQVELVGLEAELPLSVEGRIDGPAGLGALGLDAAVAMECGLSVGQQEVDVACGEERVAVERHVDGGTLGQVDGGSHASGGRLDQVAFGP